MLWDAKAKKPIVVCGQGPAPAGATISHMRDHLGLDIMPGTGLADDTSRSAASAPNPIAPRRITGASSTRGHVSAT